MSDYTDLEFEAVVEMATDNLRHVLDLDNIEADLYRHDEMPDVYDDVFGRTLEDVDGGDLWHLEAVTVSDAVMEAIYEWERTHA